jgi:hypothetical protein
VTIGLRDVYDTLQVLSNGYTALSAKLDTALIQQTLQMQNMAAQIGDVRHDINDHEMRLRSRESQNFVTARNMWTAVGVLAAVVATAFGILQVVLQL